VVDPARADEQARVLEDLLEIGSISHAVATVLATAYPALAPVVAAEPALARALADEGHRTARDHDALFAAVRGGIGARAAGARDGDRTARELRRFARWERA